jgi:hypothetical protein
MTFDEACLNIALGLRVEVQYGAEHWILITNKAFRQDILRGNYQQFISAEYRLEPPQTQEEQ